MTGLDCSERIDSWAVDKRYVLCTLITSPRLTKELLASKINTRGEQSTKMHREECTDADIYTEVTRNAWLGHRNGNWPWSSEDGSFKVQIQLR